MKLNELGRQNFGQQAKLGRLLFWLPPDVKDGNFDSS